MNVRAPLLLLLAAVLLLAGCSGRPPATATKDKAEPSGPLVARIVFDLPGDDIGTPESQQTLEAIKAALFAKGVGDLVSSGYGMGTMEITVALGSGKSVEEIRSVIGDVYPKGKYRIDQARAER